MTDGYVELHAKSFYSFGMGASHAHELLAQAKEYGYPALALTDTNLCGALEFARLANSLGMRPITGGELGPDGRITTDAAGEDAGGLLQPLPALHHRQRRQTAGSRGSIPRTCLTTRRASRFWRAAETVHSPGSRWVAVIGGGPRRF